MKIGFFTDSYLPFPDGVATSVETCARALKKKGHDVYIIAPKHPSYKDKEIHVYRLTSVKLLTPEFRFALQLPEKSLMKIFKIDFDIIHGHNGGPITLLGWEIARVRKIPYIVTYHTLFSRYAHYFFKGKIIRPKMIELISKLFGNVCDYIIAPTERVKKELILYGIKKPIYELPNGIDIENYGKLKYKKGFLRKKYKISSNKKILLYVGRLGKEKSVDFLIRSFELIHKKDPNTVLIIVGSGTEKKNLEKLVKKLDIKDYVYFTGSIKHILIPKVYTDADLFVFASQTETQGMVILEALASDLPVVAVKDAAFKNIIENGVNGYLVKKDITEFTQKILSLLHDPITYKQFSQSANITVQKYSADVVADNLIDLYKKLIKEKSIKEERSNISANNRNHIKTLNFNHIKSLLAKARAQIKEY